jgi:hypothetical protein
VDERLGGFADDRALQPVGNPARPNEESVRRVQVQENGELIQDGCHISLLHAKKKSAIAAS